MKQIEAEASRLLEIDVTIDTEPLGGADLASRARAFAAFVKGGTPLADARTAAGV